jgi:hypothetical protein
MITNIELLDEKILEIIKDNITIKILEKKQFGEVFTPYELINKMLDSLELSFISTSVNVNVFQNPDLKWLDPTAGIGNFMMVIYSRLMKGLENWEPDLEKLKKHIIENMLYMIELNETNVKISRQYFGPNANIVCEDFLTSNVFGKSFDIIIGNPPFQLNAGLGGKKKLYEQITLKCLKSNAILNLGGKLIFLVPDNLFGGNSSKTYVELLKYHIEFIDFSSFWTNSFLKIQQKICCFLLCKRFNDKENNSCKIFVDGSAFFSAQLKNRIVNPIKHWTREMDLLLDKYLDLSKDQNDKRVFYNRGKNLDCYSNININYNINFYELIYSFNKIIYTDDLSLAVGYGKKKIILFVISVDLEYFMDWKGCYGCGPNTIFITFDNDDEGKKLENFFRGDVYRELMNACKTCRKYLKIGFTTLLCNSFLI